MDNEILQEIIYLITKQAIIDKVNFELNKKYGLNLHTGSHNYVNDKDYNSAIIFLKDQCWISQSTIDKVEKFYREKREKKINEKANSRANKN